MPCPYTRRGKRGWPGQSPVMTASLGRGPTEGRAKLKLRTAFVSDRPSAQTEFGSTGELAETDRGQEGRGRAAEALAPHAEVRIGREGHRHGHPRLLHQHPDLAVVRRAKFRHPHRARHARG